MKIAFYFAIKTIFALKYLNYCSDKESKFKSMSSTGNSKITIHTSPKEVKAIRQWNLVGLKIRT